MAKKIAPLDKEIDRYYRQVELDCATLMTLQVDNYSDRVIVKKCHEDFLL